MVAASGQLSLAQQVRQTLQSLDTIADTSLVSITGLGLGEVRTLKQEIAEIFPASNLPAFLLQGLIQLDGRMLKPERISADLTVLFRGVTQLGLYGTFLAAPALLLYGYQQLLALAGKDQQSAFPDGPWHFYTQFGLREDPARHTIESSGFQQAHPQASALDAAACWVYAAMRGILCYSDLLAASWEEHALPHELGALLKQAAASEPGPALPRRGAERERLLGERVAALRQRYQLEGLEAGWARLRPLSGPPDEPLGDYPAYRQRCFRDYLGRALSALPNDLRARLDQRMERRRGSDLPAYRQQMSLLSSLRPQSYQERRAALALPDAQVALLVNARYYLLEVCARDEQGHLLIFPPDSSLDSPGVSLALRSGEHGARYDRYGNPVRIDQRGRVWAGDVRLGVLRPPPLEQVKAQVAAILAAEQEQHEQRADLLLAMAPRSQQQQLRAQLGASARAALEQLARAPILISWDLQQSALPLCDLRRAGRGVGDHALTLLRGDQGMAFDMSHIFFDALGGMALAELLTSFACALYPGVARLKGRALPGVAAPRPLALKPTPAFLKSAQAAVAGAESEVGAESAGIKLDRISRVRQKLAEIKLDLTINDLLVLARCLHAATYAPGARASTALRGLAASAGGGSLSAEIEAELQAQRSINPALLIPIDASAIDPRLRIMPVTFRNPLPELVDRLVRCRLERDLLRRSHTLDARRAFEQQRRELYAELQAFGATLRVLKEVTLRGESFSTAALRLLGHLPGPVRHLVESIPNRIAVLNEIIKGSEVFSNVGRVPKGSSLRRFASAHDDGATKQLIWGIMSTAEGQLYVTLRDSRPHVGRLLQRGERALASALAADYLESYARCANDLALSIHSIFAYKGGV